MKTQDILSQVNNLESNLTHFAFESLNTEEAAALKASFSDFKNKLENKIFDNGTVVEKKPEAKPLSIIKKQKDVGNDKNFIAHVSHEIRTPLNGIIGFTNLLREEKLTPGQQKKVEAIHSASQNLLEIINEVLEYSKLTSGIGDFNIIDFNFHGLINDVVFLCQTLIIDKNVDLKLEVDKKIPTTLVGDPSKLSQILLNLLGNSVKFVEKGFIKLKVEVLEQSKGDYVLLFNIEDTGIGISEEQLANIFQSFKQADRNTYYKYGGTGLGLSIVKELVEKQGGSINVTSKLGEGTSFKFTIPFAKGNLKNIPKTHRYNVNVKKGKELLNGTKILVFEDNKMNQHLIKEQLKRWGCKVFVTSEADNGIGILKTQSIDLILMDLKMPNMSGFEVSQKIRSDKTINQVPIIAISADFTAQDEENCITSGINDFLLKPYTLNELLVKMLKGKNERSLSKDSIALLKKEPITKSEKTLDLNGVLKDCCGEISVLEELIRLFKQNVYEFIGTVKIGLSHNNLDEIGLSAHKLKAGLTMLRLNDLTQMMVDMQENCKKENKEEVSNLFDMFLKYYPQSEKLINRSLEEIKNRQI